MRFVAKFAQGAMKGQLPRSVGGLRRQGGGLGVASVTRAGLRAPGTAARRLEQPEGDATYQRPPGRMMS
jgi:hypothetical protein